MSGTADRVIQFLVSHARCTECGAEFAPEHVHVLDEQGLRVWDLGAVCHECHTLTLVRAIVGPPRREGTPTPADAPEHEEVTRAERKHFLALEPIDADDVLDVAAFLEGFDGDFRALFGRDPET